MGFLDRIKSSGAWTPPKAKNPFEAPAPSSGTPWAPGFGSGSGVLAPATNPYIAPPAPAYNPPAPSYGGGFGGGGGNAAPAPQNFGPPEPPKQTPEDIGKLAEVDSAFMDQKSAYANALKKYVEDYTRQKGGLELDANTALTGIERNTEVGLTGLSEDFAARGLANSGMFTDSRDKAVDQYGKQKANVTTGLTNSLGDLNFRKAKYEAENGENGTNIQAARREAYARLAAAQGLT